MSFGYYDKDWVDPDESNHDCKECENYVPCKCGCGWGWCYLYIDNVEGDSEACLSFVKEEPDFEKEEPEDL